MSYVGISEQDARAMLEALGLECFEDLLEQVPEDLRDPSPPDLPPGLTEEGLRRFFAEIYAENYDPSQVLSFLGAGYYDHAWPALVDHIAGRPEFYTAYTPYQAEVSQGTLAVIFEFQTMISELAGLDVANASMYDGASAAAEALLLARAVTRTDLVALAETVNPRIRGVVETYLQGSGIEVTLIPAKGGKLDVGYLEKALQAKPAAVLIQQPNVFGLLEPLDAIGNLVSSAREAGSKTHLVVSADPVSLGILEAPGRLGAETVVGDLQVLGNPISFGGPTAGYFATRKANIRKLPGRLVAEAFDSQGRRGFTLTLQTREQHIRREKATSNICTNSALIALRSTVCLSLLGPEGIREMALVTWGRAVDAAERLEKIPEIEMPYDGPFFREFVIRTPLRAEEVVKRCFDEAGVLPGVPVSRLGFDAERDLLVAVTERRTEEDLETLASTLERVLA